MDDQSKFWDKIADRYSKKPVSDPDAYERKLTTTQEHLHEDMNVLELGCGTGTTALIHASLVTNIDAIDISPKMIEIAKSKAVQSNTKNVAFSESAVEEFTAPDESYDAIMALSVLHLLEDKERVIANAHRMLRSGGIFVTSTPCLGDTMAFFKFIGPIGKWLGLFPTVKVFTTDHLKQRLKEGGFSIQHQWQPAPGKALFIIAEKI